jgi:hypothetical protein
MEVRHLYVAYLSIYLSIYLSVYLSIHLSIYLSIYLYIYLSDATCLKIRYWTQPEFIRYIRFVGLLYLNFAAAYEYRAYGENGT